MTKTIYTFLLCLISFWAVSQCTTYGPITMSNTNTSWDAGCGNCLSGNQEVCAVIDENGRTLSALGLSLCPGGAFTYRFVLQDANGVDRVLAAGPNGSSGYFPSVSALTEICIEVVGGVVNFKFNGSIVYSDIYTGGCLRPILFHDNTSFYNGSIAYTMQHCVGLNCTPNDPCDDNDPCTINDVFDSNCDCVGTAVNCNTSGQTTTQSCDDNNPCTINDEETILNCDSSICVPCAGTALDCNTGTTTVQSCDDGNPCTTNDQQTVLDCDGSICIPCSGTVIDCSTGPTSIVSCDDGNPCTVSDLQTILDCDGSICVPCQGTLTDCTTGTTTTQACDDLDPCTENDMQTILSCDNSVCVPCAGTLIDVNNNNICDLDENFCPIECCEGELVQLCADSGVSWVWSTNDQTRCINANLTGTYTVTATDASNCTVVETCDVTINPKPVVSVNNVLIPCDGTPQTMTATGTNIASYLWSTNETTSSIQVSSAGTYTVTVTSADGCETTAMGTATEDAPCPCTPQTLTLTEQFGTPSQTCSSTRFFNWLLFSCSGCCFSNNNTIFYDIQVEYLGNIVFVDSRSDSEPCGGAFDFGAALDMCQLTPGVQYTVTITITGLTSTNTTCDFTQFNGLQFSRTDFVTQNFYNTCGCCSNQFNVSGVVTNETCGALPSNDGAINISVSGSSGYSYLWSNSSTSQDISGLGAGTYQVTVTDANGCEEIRGFIVGDNNNCPTCNITANITGDSDICPNESNVLTANGSTNGTTTYNWSTSSAGTISGSTNGVTINATSTGTYCVTITETQNGLTCSDTDCFNIVVGNCVDPCDCTSIPEPIGNCSTITWVSCGTGYNCTLQHNDGTGWVIVDSNPNTPYSPTGGIPNGTYRVACSKTGCGAITSPSILINCTTVCNATATINYTCNPNVVTWTSSGCDAVSVNRNGGLISNSPNGSYSSVVNNGDFFIIVCDETGCPTITDSETINCTIDPCACSDPKPIPVWNPLTCQITWSSYCDYTLELRLGTTVISGATSPYTPTANGAYSILCSKAGCISGVGGSVNVTSVLFPTLSSTNSTCGNSDGTATVNQSFDNYIWSNAATTQSITGLAAGTYTVTVTNNGSSCEGIASVTVTDIGGVSASANCSDTDCGQMTGSAMAIGTGGAAPFTYEWSTSPVQTSQTATGLSAGNYIVTITDANGCESVANCDVGIIQTCTSTTAPTGDCEEIEFSSPCSSDGYICVLQFLGQTGWTTVSGSSPYDPDPTGEGDYRVKCIKTGCDDVDSPVLNLANCCDGFFANAGVDQTICDGQSTTISGSQVGGVAPFIWQWTAGGGQTITVAPATTTTYTLSVTDADGCLATDQVTISVTDCCTDVQTNASCTSTLCASDSGTASVVATGGSAPYVYAWSNGGNTASISSLSGGIYSVIVTDSNNCTSIATCTVNVDSGSVVASASCNDTDCGETNGSANGSASGGLAPYTYAWSNSSSTQNITGLGVGTYILTVTDANGCTGTSQCAIDEVQTCTSAPNVSGDCNQLTYSINTCVGHFTILQYSSNGSTGWTNIDTDGDYEPVNGTGTGFYRVIIIKPGCDDAIGPIIQVACINCSNVAVAATCTPTTCTSNSGTATASGSGGSAPYTFTWSNSMTGAIITGLGAGTYTVTITDANNCTNVSSCTVTTTTNTLTPIATCMPEICDQNNGAATVSGSWASLVWSNSQTTATITNLDSGTYTVTVTDSDGCTGTANCTVTNDLGDLVASATCTNTICNGNSGTATGSVTGGTAPYNYVWDNSATSATITNLSVGTYSFTVTDANGCTDTGACAVGNTNNTLTPTLTCDDPTCGLMNGMVSVDQSFTSYAWSSGQSTQSVSGLGSGTYTVTVTDSDGCTATVSCSITDQAGPIANAGADVTICEGDCTDLTGSGSGGTAPYSYSWSSGDNTAVSNVCPISTTTYTLTVTDANGCTSTDQVVVDVNENEIQADLITSPIISDVICDNGDYIFQINDFLNVTCPNNCCGSQISFPSIDVTILVNGSSAGIVETGGIVDGCIGSYVNNITMFGCPISAGDQLQIVFNNVVIVAGDCDVFDNNLNLPLSTNIYTIQSNDLCPSLITNAGPDQTICDGDNTQLAGTATGGTMPYTFDWGSAGSGNPVTVSPTSTTTYILTVTDDNGCTDTDTVLVNVTSCPPPIFSAWSSCDCTGSQTRTITTPTCTGGVCNDVVTTDTRSCDACDVPANLPVVTAMNDVTICEGDNVNLTATATGCAGGFVYNWSGGSTTVMPSVTTTYTVTVTDSNGCTGTDQVTVTVEYCCDCEPIFITCTDPCILAYEQTGSDCGLYDDYVIDFNYNTTAFGNTLTKSDVGGFLSCSDLVKLDDAYDIEFTITSSDPSCGDKTVLKSFNCCPLVIETENFAVVCNSSDAPAPAGSYYCSVKIIDPDNLGFLDFNDITISHNAPSNWILNYSGGVVSFTHQNGFVCPGSTSCIYQCNLDPTCLSTCCAACADPGYFASVTLTFTTPGGCVYSGIYNMTASCQTVGTTCNCN